MEPAEPTLRLRRAETDPIEPQQRKQQRETAVQARTRPRSPHRRVPRLRSRYGLDRRRRQRGRGPFVRDQEVVDSVHRDPVRPRSTASPPRRITGNRHRQGSNTVRPRSSGSSRKRRACGRSRPKARRTCQARAGRGSLDRLLRERAAQPPPRLGAAGGQEQPVAWMPARSSSRSGRSRSKRAGVAAWTQMCGVPGARVTGPRSPGPREPTGPPGRPPAPRGSRGDREDSRARGRSSAGVDGSCACAGRPVRCASLVDPKIATPGRPSAAARCAGPESLPTKRLALARTPMASAEVGAAGEVHGRRARASVLAHGCRARARPRSRAGRTDAPSHAKAAGAGAEPRGRPALGAAVGGARGNGEVAGSAVEARPAKQPACGRQHVVGGLDPGGSPRVSSRMRATSSTGAAPDFAPAGSSPQPTAVARPQ